MYKICKTEQSAERQRQIESLLYALMEQKRFEDITVTEICEQMSMPRKAFYRYFDTKEDALFALLDHTMSEYAGFTVDKSREKHRSLTSEIEEYFKFWFNRRGLLDVLNRSGMLSTLVERTANFPVDDIIPWQKFLNKEDLTIKNYIFRFTFSGLVYTMINWYKSGFRESTRQIAKITCRMFREPLFPGINEIGMGE